MEGESSEAIALQVAFGARVRELRRAKGLTQEGLSHASGVDRSYVGQVERGERNIALVNIHRLATALGVDPSELLRAASPEGEESDRAD